MLDRNNSSNILPEVFHIWNVKGAFKEIKARATWSFSKLLTVMSFIILTLKYICECLVVAMIPLFVILIVLIGIGKLSATYLVIAIFVPMIGMFLFLGLAYMFYFLNQTVVLMFIDYSKGGDS